MADGELDSPTFRPSRSQDILEHTREIEDYLIAHDLWGKTRSFTLGEVIKALADRIGPLENGMQTVLAWIGAQKIKWGFIVVLASIIGGLIAAVFAAWMGKIFS